VLDLPFRPDRGRSEAVFRQLEEHLRGLIETGRLAPGAKLPATRVLAASLGLSRTTVSLAYDTLVAGGWLRAHVGQGTFVAEGKSVAPAAAYTSVSPARGFVWPGLFAGRVRALAAPRALLLPQGHPPIRYDFSGGQVDRDSLPRSELRSAFSRAAARDLADLAAHRDPFGWPPLRREIAGYLVGRGIRCSPDEVAVVNGSQQAITLAAHMLVDPGDTVVMEQPGYFGAAMAFRACQANLVGVGVDAEGIRTDELARVSQARRVKLVYVTPGAQSPTGVTMSAQRRRDLLALADAHQTPILEDDYDAELRYEAPAVAALKSLDPAGQVIYAGTFSKVLLPALRVGYVVAARPLLEAMVLARFHADITTCLVTQAALAALLRSGALDRHLRRVRRIYSERLAAMLDALADAMPRDCSFSRPRSGHSVWLRLPPGVDPDAVFRAAVARGIAYTRGEAFHFDNGNGEAIALSFAALGPWAIREGIAILADVVAAQVGRRRRRNAASTARLPSPRGGLSGNRLARAKKQKWLL
jgi:GntR family transcriptional regulator/MocR family aminotransferase